MISAPALANPKYLTIGKIRPTLLRPGRTVTVVVPVKVEGAFHLQANPASKPELIPTTLTVETVGGVTPGKVIYPPGKPYHFPGSPVEFSTYQGSFELHLPLSATRNAHTGKVVLTGELKAQACNDKICFPPATVPVSIPLNVKR